MMAGLDPRSLSRVALFGGLDLKQLAEICGLLQHKVFPAGASIIMTDQPGEVFYIVQSGSVKVFVEQDAGSEVVLAILGPGEIFGEMGLINSLGRSANVVTGERSTLLWMNRTDFQTLVRETPQVSNNLVEILSRRLRLANARNQLLATFDVRGRVAGQILALSREYGEKTPEGGVRIPLRLTQTDLAGMVGASRVRVNQVLGFFKRQGAISVGRDRRITVHNPEFLAGRTKNTLL